MRARFLGTTIGVLMLPFGYAACGSDGDAETVAHSGPADHGEPGGSGGELGNGGALGASGNGGGAIPGSGGNGAAGIGGAAGVSGSNGSGGTSADGASGDGGTPGMDGSAGGETGGLAPVIPAINGACPAFENGTVSVGGLSGILIAAGAKAAAPKAPLVFYWHGTASTSDEFMSRAPALPDAVSYTHLTLPTILRV